MAFVFSVFVFALKVHFFTLFTQEIAKKELGTLKEKKESLDKELGVLETEAGKLQALYDEQVRSWISTLNKDPRMIKQISVDLGFQNFEISIIEFV